MTPLDYLLMGRLLRSTMNLNTERDKAMDSGLWLHHDRSELHSAVMRSPEYFASPDATWASIAWIMVNDSL